MMKLQSVISTFMPHGPMDAMGVGVIDFKTNRFEFFEALKTETGLALNEKATQFFDLASLTKPLTNSLAYFLRPEVFDEKMLLCLSHRGSLPAWGLLPYDSWKEQILAYPIQKAETLYSDFSALRVMLELERKGIDQKALCQGVWDKDTLYWTDLPMQAQCPPNGARSCEVHDPNAWVINAFCSHAGLFGTISSLCQTLLNYQKQTDFIAKTKADLQQHSHRFALGWDRVVNPQDTLAGKGCGHFTFGHLGFTGTSIWIDAEKMRGHVILSNATKYHWYDKQVLNDIRRAIGELVWSM